MNASEASGTSDAPSSGRGERRVVADTSVGGDARARRSPARRDGLGDAARRPRRARATTGRALAARGSALDAGSRRGVRCSPRASAVAARSAHGSAIAAAAAIGTWTMKIARQSKTSVSAPPIAGPAAVPDQRRAEPEAAAGARLARVEHVEGREQRRGAADGLQRAEDEQHAERAGEAAAERGRPRTARSPTTPARTGAQPRGRQDAEREHERVDADDRGDAR